MTEVMIIQSIAITGAVERNLLKFPTIETSKMAVKRQKTTF